MSSVSKWAHGLLSGLLLLPVLFALFPGSAGGANRLMDLRKVRNGEGRTRLALLLQQKPKFRLSYTRSNQAHLLLYETTGPEGLARSVAAKGNGMTLEEDKTHAGLKLTLLLGTSPRECEWSWIPGEKVLLVDWVDSRKETVKSPEETQQPTLRALRFGVRNEMTRMVADLDGRPLWAMASRQDRVLSFQLPGVSKGLSRSSYGPMRRLGNVVILKEGADLEIKAELDTPPERVRVFWLKEDGRWVVDFFDQPPERLEAALRFDKRGVQGVEKAEPKASSDRKDTARPGDPSAEKSSAGDPATMGAKAPAPTAAAAQADGQATGLVRMKIPKAPAAEPQDAAGQDAVKASAVRQKTPQGVAMQVDPKVRYAPPELSGGAERVAGLKPAEAILYGRIREVLDAGDYEKAAALINEFLSAHPDSALTEDMVFLSGDCLFALLEKGNKPLYPKVVRSYQEAIARFPKSGRAAGALVKMARAHELAGNDQEAVGVFTMVINQHRAGEHLPGALVARGRIYLRLNQPKRAIEDFRTVITRFPDSPVADEAHYGVAGYYHGVGMYDEAEAKLKEIVERRPDFHIDRPEFLSLRARNYFYRKKYDQAREQYFRALNLGRQPETSDLLISHIGDTYHHQSREKEAEALYRAAVTFFPNSEGAGIAKLRVAAHSSGVSAYEEIYRKNVDKPIGDLAVLEMAGRFYKKGQYGLAAENLKRLMGKPVQTDIQREARQLYFRCAEKEIKGFFDGGHYRKVIDYYQSADPPLSGSVEPEVMMLVGESFSRSQLYPEAVRIFSQLSLRDLSPESRGRYVLSFARIHLSQGGEEEARSLLENASVEKLLPGDRQRANLLLAEICREKGEMKRASDLLQSILGEKRLLSDREMASLYLGLGKIHLRQNLSEKARESLNRSIALAEKDRENREVLRSAYLELGNSYHAEGRHQDAVRHYGQCLDLDYSPETKGYWDVKYKLALSYLGTGETAMADRIMNEIAEEGDPAIQQRVQVKMGFVGLERELKRLSMGKRDR